MTLMEVKHYVVSPAVNGWFIEFKDCSTGIEHKAVFKTSAEVANFFKGLDKGRVSAQKQLATKEFPRPPARYIYK